MLWCIIIIVIALVAGGFIFLRFTKTKNTALLKSDFDLYFEPQNPITTPEEFSNEIINYFSKTNQFVSIIEASMEPIINIDGEIYICKLGQPFRVWNPLKMPINPYAGRFLGYKWVYIYKKDKTI